MTNLRRARLDDNWRKVYNRNYNAFLVSAIYCNGAIFDGLEVGFDKGINALVGRNGVGKSNLIRSMYNCLLGAESNQARFSAQVDIGDIAVTVSVKDVSTTLEVKSGVAHDVDVDIVGFMYDPCTLIPAIQQLFLQQTNLEELLEGYSQLDVDLDGISLINFLTNGEYLSFKIVNIEYEYENFPIAPFFIVKTSAAEYDSRSMGLGELSLFYFFWLTKYMGGVEKNKLLFVEEPESFLPPAAQERLSDILALTAAMQGISIIVSTHSEHILKKIPRENIKIVKKSVDGVRCYEAVDSNEPIKVLGLSCPKAGVLFYEDIAAELFIKSLLKKSCKYVADSFFYHNAGSDGGVLKIIEHLPSHLEKFLFIGVFDGDSRAGLNINSIKSKNFLFLPAENPPEVVLINYMQSSSVEALAGILGITPEQMVDARNDAAGRDHHDYFHELARNIGAGFYEVFSKMCSAWVFDEKNSADVELFIQSLESVIESVG